MGDTGVSPFTRDSLLLFFFSSGVLAGVLGLKAGAPGAGLLVAGVPFTWGWARPLAFALLLFFLPVLGGWLPPVATGVAPSGLAPSSGAAASNLRFLRFLVSGKNPFFFRFVLMGLSEVPGTSLVSFFSTLGRLGESGQEKEAFSEDRGYLHLGFLGTQTAQSPYTQARAPRHAEPWCMWCLPSPLPGVGLSAQNLLDSEHLHGLPVQVIEAAGADGVLALL